MTHRNGIKVMSAALDETPSGEIILRGVIAADSLTDLKKDAYQREAMDNAKVRALQSVIANDGIVPDVVLGMRGQRYIEREGVVYLQDPVYIVDGLQRITAAMRAMTAQPDVCPHIGATIHFDTNPVSEQDMFERLNLGQTRLSPNVTLRNYRHKVSSIASLYNLTEDKSFVLHGLVSWDQNMRRGQLITANTYVKTAGMLHSHAGPGRNNNVADLASGVAKIQENVGRNIFIQNTRLFFDVIDACYGIRRVTYKSSAPFIKSAFLLQMARVFSDHTSFWRDNRLVIDKRMITKLASFPIGDPEVVRLCSAGGTAGELLYMLIVNHINHGKRTGRLVLRRGIEQNEFDLSDVGYDGGE